MEEEKRFSSPRNGLGTRLSWYIQRFSGRGAHLHVHVHVQYRSRGTYTRVKKFTRVISTRHASGVTIFLEFEYSSARVQELECSSGRRVRGLESSSARTLARALAHKTARAVGTIDHACTL